MQYKYVSIQAGMGWQTVTLSSSILNGERLTIIPVNSTVKQGAKGVATVSVSPLPPFGTAMPIYVNAGQEVSLTASGTWSWNGTQPNVGPNGQEGTPGHSGFRLPGANKWSLIGRIGEGPWFYVGTSYSFIATSSGVLTLGMNDDFYSDNSGSLSVEIRAENTLCGLKGRVGAGAEFPVGQQFDNYADASGSLQLAAEDCGAGKISALVIVGAPGVPNHNSDCPFGNDREKQSSNPIELRTGTKVLSETDLTVQTPAGALTFTRTYNQAKQSHSAYQFMGLGWSHNHRYQLALSGTSPNRTAELALPEGGTLKLDEVSGTPGTFKAQAGSTSELEHDTTNGEYVLTTQDKSRYCFDDTTLLLQRRDWPNHEVWTYSYDTSDRLVEVADAYGRKLVLAYINNPGQYNHSQLWRVGDHATTNLETTPVGRYVEFTYTPEKLNGVTVSNPKALLASVRDVRGTSWLYDHYGQVSGEANATLANLLTRRRSPSVDTTGDGSADGSLTLEQLSYTFSGTTLAKLTQQRGNGLLATEFRFQPNGKNVTEETLVGASTPIQQRSRVHHFANGVYIGAANPLGELPSQVLGAHYRPQAQADALTHQTQLEWDTDGKDLNGVTDALNHETAFSYNPDDTLDFVEDTEGRKTEYTYGDLDNPRLPTEVKVYDTDGTTLLRFQKFSYDDQGRTLTEQVIDPDDAVTVLQEVTRTYYDSGDGNGLLHTVTQSDLGGTDDVTTTYTYDSAGRVVKTQQSSNFGTCQISYTIYDAAGNVVASICNYDPGTNPDPTTAAQAVALYDEQNPEVNRVTTHAYDTLGRRVKTTVNAGASFAQTTLTAYDALNRVIRAISNYVPTVGIPHPYTAAHSAFSHGTDNNQNLVTDTAYNARGLVRKQTDVLGHVTLFGYDEADRLIKTVQNASLSNYNNDYGGTSPDPALSSYVPNSATDQDLITENGYDAAGNLVQTVDALGNVSFTVYDALNRPVKTVHNAKEEATIALDPGDTGYDAANDPRSASYAPSSDPDRDFIELTEYDAMGRVRRTQDLMGAWTLYGYDPLGRQVKVIRSASNPTYNSVNDPDLSGYTLDTAPDLDIVTETVYDANGRVLYTEDMLGRRTWFAYDGLGRQVKTIANAVGTATDGGVNDPRSASYVPSTDSDKDLITITHYDVDGRVQWTQDKLGRKTWNVYDALGRRIKTIVNCTYVSGSPVPEDPTYVGSSDPDADVITRTEYDAQGRVFATFDADEHETRLFYDVLGRQIKVIRNYVDGVFNANVPDEDLIETTTYDLAGRVIETVDARGTKTAFTYDAAGRRRIVTQAADTPLQTSSYTCYDRSGRVLRAIQNWIDRPGQPSPDAKDGNGDWLFNPTEHGAHDDENLITSYTLDQVGRTLEVMNPVGDTSTTVYFKNGQVQSVTDPEGMVTQYRYDQLHRRVRVVQGFQGNGEDPALWVWDASDTRWEESDGTPIAHGTNDDSNVIVLVTYDKAGRMTSLRDPRGNLTTYSYDLRDRRLEFANPLGKTWETEYADLSSGGTPTGETRTTLTYPNGATHQVQREFDRLGRLKAIHYLNETPKLTPDVTFSYNKLGNRLNMLESDGVDTLRETLYSYDDARRLTSVGFDHDGDSTVDETVSYEYDAGGLRTKLTLPGNLSVTYTYDAKGRLVSLTDWDDQTTTFAHDNANRLLSSVRPNGLRCRYSYDPASRLRWLRHTNGGRTLAHFAYEVDRRGNRTRAVEALMHPATTSDLTIAYDDAGIAYKGTWSNSAPFKVTTDTSASLHFSFMVNLSAATQPEFTFGTGPDHGIFDVYVGGSLWQSFDGYAASAGERTVELSLSEEGPLSFEIRARKEKNRASSGYTVRFKQLLLPDVAYDLHTIAYQYDLLSRLLGADYYPGSNVTATPFRAYDYTYDLAGNRLSQSLSLNGGTPTVTNYTYNAANQISNVGFSYDNNGNLTSDGTNTYTWDRANRLLSMGGVDYTYDGMGNRVKQTVGVNVTQYLLDMQPGLSVVLAETQGANTTRYVHGPTGIHAHKDNAGNWEWILQDGLGTVRGVVDNNMSVLESRFYDPIGVLLESSGTNQTMYNFTGEPMDGNGLLYLRARYYAPNLGIFPNLDPFEGSMQRPMSLNGYSWVEGNSINATDPSGKCMETTVCDQLQRTGCSVRELLRHGCISLVDEPEECCGPVADDWFRRVVNENLLYDGGAVNYPIFGAMSFETLGAIFGGEDTFGLAEHVLREQPIYRYATYGLVLRTALIDYRAMAQMEQGITPIYTDTQTSNQLITLCGQCINASDFGNFLFGVAGYAWGFSFDLVVNGAQLFNAVTRDWSNIIRSGYDIQGVMAGYEFAQHGTSESAEDFCQRIRNTTRFWNFQRFEDARFTEHTQVPCGEFRRTATLDNAPIPVPNWNRYIFDPPVIATSSWPYSTPEEELRSRWQR